MTGASGPKEVTASAVASVVATVKASDGRAGTTVSSTTSRVEKPYLRRMSIGPIRTSRPKNASPAARVPRTNVAENWGSRAEVRDRRTRRPEKPPGSAVPGSPPGRPFEKDLGRPPKVGRRSARRPVHRGRARTEWVLHRTRSGSPHSEAHGHQALRGANYAQAQYQEQRCLIQGETEEDCPNRGASSGQDHHTGNIRLHGGGSLALRASC